MSEDDNTFSVQNANDSSGFLLWQVISLWQQEIKKVLEFEYNITHSQYVIMASIHWLTLLNDEVTQVVLSQHTKIEPMNVSQLLKVLENKLLTSKKTHSTDPRAKAVSLTEQGKELIKKAIITIEEIDKRFFGKLGKKQKAFNQDLLVLLKK